MEQYSWLDKYSVNIQEIDAQHKQLLAIMVSLHEAMLARESKAALGDILGKLIKYTQEHFTYEEGLLRKFDYPAYEDHKRNHDELRDKVFAMQDDYANGKIIMSLKVMEFLLSWLKKHIMGCDFLYRDFLRGEGVR